MTDSELKQRIPYWVSVKEMSADEFAIHIALPSGELLTNGPFDTRAEAEMHIRGIIGRTPLVRRHVDWLLRKFCHVTGLSMAEARAAMERGVGE